MKNIIFPFGLLVFSLFSLNVWAAPSSKICSQYGTFIGKDDRETSLYNLAIDNMCQDMEEDGTFRTGELWGGVWTRDVSYSIILSLAHVEPQYSKASLMRKVDRLGRIIQDTGTGGAWPVSVDREIWTVAAYELWLETGDEEWLEKVYRIGSRSIRDDYATSYNNETGLFRGESSFIDWRHQSYPEWTDCKDICQSECLGTNAVFVGALKSLAEMAKALGYAEEAEAYANKAMELAGAINKWLWMEDKGYYAQYRYGRVYKTLSPRSETLGESLCVLFGVASGEQAASIFRNMPVSQYGPTIFWPQIADQRPYHNNAVWPFVTSYYALAASMAGSRAGVHFAIEANNSYAAEHGTYYENRVSSDGSTNTCMNSPRQLWSLAGAIGTYRRLLLGINYQPEGIVIAPNIPSALGGTRSLKGLKYRDMVLDVTVSGEGDIVKSCTFDGEKCERAFVPSDAKGHHTICIEMESEDDYSDVPVGIQSYTADIAVPQARLEGRKLKWEPVDGADHYKVLFNGKVVRSRVSGTKYRACRAGEYSVIAVNEDGVDSFMSEPVQKFRRVLTFSADDREISTDPGVQHTVTVRIPRKGVYAVDWLYSNGNGEIETQNKCAVRTMCIDGERCDVVVLPQRGKDDWESQGWSNTVIVSLRRGRHTVEMSYPEENINMNIDEDRAVLHSVRFSLVK